MSFTKKILYEHLVKYVFTYTILAVLWNPIKTGLVIASKSGKLEAIAVVMGIVSLCSLTGYFAFSYTTVSKRFLPRIFGYFCTFFLGLSLLLSLAIIYFIALIWIPEMQLVWMATLLSLYIGTVIFDNLDLLRMGLDVAATNFFEKDHENYSDSKFSSIIHFLKEGQRLEYANSLIGQAMVELGKEKKDKEISESGKWILDNSNKEQHIIDEKVAETFSKYNKDQKIKKITADLLAKQNQNIADSLIANLLEIIKNKKN